MIRVFKVSELLENIKITLSENFPVVDVSGEIGDVNANSRSGHIYFNLKEDKNVISCACWKNNAIKLKTFIEEGKQVKIRGRVLSYPTNSKFYINVASITEEGKGATNANLLKLKEDLTKEGLFLDIHKKAITKYPKSIGLITSSDGDVINDIKTTLKSTYPCRLLLFDVPVQGEDSTNKICEAIDYFNSLKGNIPSFLIIARGGGSGEDLFHFNDEKLVRKIFDSKIPIVTAIGHDPDSTLADMVSDKFVATPTASVAFLANNIELKENINVLKEHLLYLLIKNLKNLQAKLITNAKFIKTPIAIISNNKEKINYLSLQLKQRVSQLLYSYNSDVLLYFNQINNYSLHLKNYINKYKENTKYLFFKQKNLLISGLNNYQNNISVFLLEINKVKLTIKNNEQKLFYITRILNSLSFKETLKRGFSVISQNGEIIKSFKNLQEDKSFEIEFYDGKKSITKN